MFTLILKNTNLTPSKHDPYLYTGILADPDAPTKPPPSGSNPSNPSSTSVPSTSTDHVTISIGLHMDDSVFYST